MQKKNYLITILTTFVFTLFLCVVAVVCIFKFTDAYKLVGGIAPEGTTAKIETVLKSVQEEHLYEVDEEKLIDSAIAGMLSAIGDPYTFYMTAEQYKESTALDNPTFVGIGVTINIAEKEDALVIREVHEGSQLHDYGIQFGDEIIGVSGQRINAENKDTLKDEILGEEGTFINLTFRKADGSEFSQDIQRRQIRVRQTVSSIYQDNIGYIRLRSFQKTSYTDFKLALDNLRTQGITSLIIDLRGNGGGYKNVALDITDMFVPEGVICTTVNKNGVVSTDKGTADVIDIPFVILVDNTSASASELFSGAVQDYGTGKLIGSTTFGKGIVQYTYPFPDGSYYQYTAEQWLTPKGRYIHNEGLTPDIVVELDEETQYYIDSQPALIPSTDYDLQLQAAIDELSKKN